MSTQTETLRTALELDAFERQAAAKGSFTEQRRARWDPNRFAEQQIRWLVRQVFFSQERDAPRQVVFSAVQNNDIGAICLQVGQILSDQVSGSTCVVEADARALELESVLINNGRQPGVGQKTFSPLRNSSQKISEQLWRVPLKTFLGDQQKDLSSAWLRERLAELRLEFDYAVIQAPAAGYSEAALLGQLSDGMILVLQANSTRRAAAKKVKQMLLATNVRLLGAVLSERTFPIPQKLYRKL